MQKVLAFDAARAPSGRAVWWAEIFKRGVGGRQRKEAKRRAGLSVDERILEGYDASAENEQDEENEEEGVRYYFMHM